MISEITRISSPQEDSHIGTLLFKTSAEHPLMLKLAAIENGSLLDLGCRFPALFFPLYHRFKFKEFWGVDLEMESEALEKFIGNNPKLKEAAPKDFYELYRLIYKQVGAAHQPIISDRELFYETFGEHLHLGTDIRDFFEEYPDKKFDFVAMVNLLHVLPDYEAMLQCLSRAEALLKPDGIFYMRVYNGHHYDIRELMEHIAHRYDSGSLSYFEQDGVVQYFKFLMW